MTLDDLLRLAELNGGSAAARPDLRGMAAPTMQQMAPSAPAPAIGNAAETSPFSRLDASGMGDAGILERIGAHAPSSPIAALIDLTGTILRGGHSGYGDAMKRARLNLASDKLKQEHTDTRLAAEKAKQDRDAAVLKDRIERLSTALDNKRKRLTAIYDAAQIAGLSPEELAIKKVEYQRLVDEIKRNSADLARLGAVDPETGFPLFPEKPVPPKLDDAGATDAALHLSPGGLDMAATAYVQTGTLPAAGIGKEGAKVRAAIINRAAEMFPGANLASNKASTKADTESQTQLQKLYDSATAFENTALRNAKVLREVMAQAGGTKSPLVNKPLRTIQTALGRPENAALATAVATVQNEFSRLLSNPSAAGVLSDNARHEGQSMLSGNYSLAQMVAAIEVLKADAENKRAAYNGQLDEIRARMRQRAVPTEEKVLIITPDGRRRLVSSSKLAEAKKRGAREVR